MASEVTAPKAGATELSPAMLRYIGAAGHGCLLGMLILFILLYRFKGEPYDATWQLVLMQVLSGRAGSAHLGMQLGFNRYYLLFQISMHDFILMLYLYPWFVRGYQHLSRVHLIGSSLVRLDEFVLRNKDHIAPYGVVGLLIFVFFPFWNVGPLVGVCLAYVIGLRAVVAFASVIAGNVVAVAAWIWAYDMLQQYNKTLAAVLLVILFALAMSWPLYVRRRRAHKDAPHETQTR